MSKKFIQGLLAIAIPFGMLMTIAVEANARGGRGGGVDPILSPQSCYWKRKNWFCRPL